MRKGGKRGAMGVRVDDMQAEATAPAVPVGEVGTHRPQCVPAAFAALDRLAERPEVRQRLVDLGAKVIRRLATERGLGKA